MNCCYLRVAEPDDHYIYQVPCDKKERVLSLIEMNEEMTLVAELEEAPEGWHIHVWDPSEETLVD